MATLCTGGVRALSQSLAALEFPTPNTRFLLKVDHAFGTPTSKFYFKLKNVLCLFLFSLKCSVCTKKTIKQCVNTKASDIAEECYSSCGSAKDRKCDGNLYNCLTIPRCGPGAECDPRSGKCRCSQGTSGNGQQCFQGDCASGNCTLLVNSEQNVEVKIEFLYLNANLLSLGRDRHTKPILCFCSWH